MAVTRNSRNSRAVQCNWKFPNCKNRTRDTSGYCQVHRTLAARVSGDNLMYGKGETEIGNRSRFTADAGIRSSVYAKVSEVLESYPVINISSSQVDGKTAYRATINHMTKEDLVASGVELHPSDKEGFNNVVALTRDSEDEALYAATTVAASAWDRRVAAIEAQNPEMVDIYDSAVEAIAYARDWQGVISELEMKHGLAATGRSISFSHDTESNELSMKVYHQSKNEGTAPHDHITFSNLIRFVPQKDGSTSYIPNTVINWERSYSSPDGAKRNTFGSEGGTWESPITAELTTRVSRLVADSNKFGLADTDGRLKIPTGWEMRSKSKE